MNPFEQAQARADEIAPAPVDTPLAAAATAFGFGLLVVFLFLAFQYLGAPVWLAWGGAALGYGAIAYGDCLIGWNRHRREYRDALAELKDARSPQSLH